MIDKSKAIKFLERTAEYFLNRPTKGEDRAHWANVYNSEVCHRIIERLENSEVK